MEDDYIEHLSETDGDSPNMVSLKRSWMEDTQGASGFIDRLADNYKQRRNQWAGKTSDLRKNSPDARPYQYASDNEAWIIDPRIDAKVSICWNAWMSAQVSAIPVGSDDVERSTSVTNFMRYTMNSWVKNPQREFNLASNNMFEKTFSATYVGWRKLRQRLKERINLEQLAIQAPEIAEAFADEDREEEVIEMIMSQFEFVNEKSARKSLKQLRKNGFADFAVSETSIDEPVISTKAPDSEIFFPPYTLDPEKADRCHIVEFMSRPAIIATAMSEEWNEDVVQELLEDHMGVSQDELDGDSDTDAWIFETENVDTNDLALVVRTLIRKVDPDDGSLGIYEVVWSPRMAQDEEDEKFLSYDLINGLDCLPIAVTTYKDDAKRLFEGRSDCESLRGIQRDAKILSDLGADNANLAMDPPRFYPVGGNLPRWSSGASIAIRRGTAGDYGTFDVPNMMPQTAAMQEYLDKQADSIVGLNMDDPNSVQRLQYSTSRMLLHWSKVTKLVWKMYKLYGPEEKAFRITNDATIAPSVFKKGADNEDLDVMVQFDVRLNDPEYREQITESSIKLMAVDSEGAANRRDVMNVLWSLNLPQYASSFLRTSQEANADLQKKVMEDLSSIFTGQGVDAQPNGAQLALNYIEQYVTQPDVFAKLQSDPAFAERIETYSNQYEFQLQQAENAQTGRLGTAATLGGGNLNV